MVAGPSWARRKKLKLNKCPVTPGRQRTVWDSGGGALGTQPNSHISPGISTPPAYVKWPTSDLSTIRRPRLLSSKAVARSDSDGLSGFPE